MNLWKRFKRLFSKKEIQTCLRRKKNFDNGEGLDYWEYWNGNNYRQCSYCGGLHPEDAIAFIEAGVKVVFTDKWYKCYLYPKGTKKQIKVYSQHFSKEQLATFKKMLKVVPDGCMAVRGEM